MIAGLFFTLYNKTVRQLRKYHIQIVKVQNMMLVFKIIDDAPDSESKNIMLHKVLEWIVPRDRNYAPPRAMPEKE
jgi:hypothetical protein